MEHTLKFLLVFYITSIFGALISMVAVRTMKSMFGEPTKAPDLMDYIICLVPGFNTVFAVMNLISIVYYTNNK